jgi:molybdate/tungstate transport system substrate-binding protein
MAAAVIAAAALAPVGAATARVKKHSGNVNVLYAASLQQIMTDSIGPAFQKATGYTFVGYPAASGTLATEIKSGVYQGDVFISANTATNASLEGPTNGNWVSTFVVFGNSPLVLGYSKTSPFATSIRTMPWFVSVTQPGIRIGRTDPSIDPKGKLTTQAIAAGVQLYNDPGLASVTASSANIYPEQALVGLIQSGQLDAGFFYASEAKAAGIPVVKLGRLSFSATYTIADLANAPDAAGAAAFTSFLLGPAGHRLLTRNGVTVVRPRIDGPTSALPASVRATIRSSS